MASIKFKNAIGVERGCEEGFGGIDQSAAQISSDRQATLVNFDVLADGSLKTRRGYREELEFSAPIRATLSAGKSFYCLAGRELTLTDTESGERTVIAELPTDSGDAELFFFGGELCLLDSQKLYRYDGASLAEFDGYAPLYGKEWHPSERGAVYEDINPASDRIRISYLTADSLTVFDIGIAVSSLDRVELNGRTLNLSDQGILLENNKVEFSRNVALADGMLVTFWLTLDGSSSKRSKLAEHVKSFIFSNGGAERLCLYSPAESAELLCSRAVSDAELYESRKTAPTSSALYLGSSVRIGNGSSPITGMAHHFDRALLFTDANAWCVDFEGDEGDVKRTHPRVFMLNSGIGAESLGSTANCENDPLTCYRGKIFRWHSQSGVRDECSAELISEPISKLMPAGENGVSMLSVPHIGLVLICDPEDVSGSMIVYNTSRGVWSVYSGIFAEKLFLYASSPAFSRGGSVYVFSEDADNDLDEGENIAIKSYLLSHFTDLGAPERTKRSARILIDGNFSADAILELETERGEKRRLTIEKSVGIISERLGMPRFKRLRYKLECRGASHINNIILSAK
jgi:hypothetical protein